MLCNPHRDKVLHNLLQMRKRPATPHSSLKIRRAYPGNTAVLHGLFPARAASACFDDSSVEELAADDFQAAELRYDDAHAVEATSLAIPTESTPLYSRLIAKLCLHGLLQFKAPTGSAAQPAVDLTTPYSLSMRIENLLNKPKKQRLQ